MTIAAGVVVRNLVGRRLVNSATRMIERIPLIATIYKLFRQISDAFLGGGDKGFKRVVLVEWPRREVWTLAFVTGEATGRVTDALTSATESDAGPYWHLFVPTTPNPTSGFYCLAPQRECRLTTLTVEEAFKVIISGGALA